MVDALSKRERAFDIQYLLRHAEAWEVKHEGRPWHSLKSVEIDVLAPDVGEPSQLIRVWAMMFWLVENLDRGRRLPTVVIRLLDDDKAGARWCSDGGFLCRSFASAPPDAAACHPSSSSSTSYSRLPLKGSNFDIALLQLRGLRKQKNHELTTRLPASVYALNSPEENSTLRDLILSIRTETKAEAEFQAFDCEHLASRAGDPSDTKNKDVEDEDEADGEAFIRLFAHADTPPKDEDEDNKNEDDLGTKALNQLHGWTVWLDLQLDTLGGREAGKLRHASFASLDERYFSSMHDRLHSTHGRAALSTPMLAEAEVALECRHVALLAYKPFATGCTALYRQRANSVRWKEMVDAWCSEAMAS